MSINTGGQTDTLIQRAKKPFLRERLTYRAAGPVDLDLLTETRIQVLRAANRLGRRSGGAGEWLALLWTMFPGIWRCGGSGLCIW